MARCTFAGVPAILLFLFQLASDDFTFVDPRPVTITGYSGDAMEPFLTPDGRDLLFNNSNADPARTDLQWAERIDDVTFAYRGTLSGANSTALDAVASIDSDGAMYFISTRDPALATVYRATFENGVVRDVVPLPALTAPGHLIFDAGVSEDGSTLYLSDGVFNGGAVPASADLAIAVRTAGGGLQRIDDGEFADINTAALEYAACISSDRLELFFTRIVGGVPQIFRSTRSDSSSPWRPPRRLAAISGFVEAPAIAPGGNALYYHANRGGRFVIERVTRRLRRRAAAH
ncbi:MAG TPA: hypothetical protein VL284_03185 [Thermoanaerobaculia bacterium]|nr:hypothetical protein [Thermoanaerobaculia bacterium]